MFTLNLIIEKVTFDLRFGIKYSNTKFEQPTYAHQLNFNQVRF